MKVATVKGDLEVGDLRVQDVTQWSDNARVTATEWYLGDELVRRDVWVNPLRYVAIGAEVSS